VGEASGAREACVKITDVTLDAVHVNHRGDWVFVSLHTDEGITGLGELRAGRQYGAQLESVRELGAALEGRDPRQIEKFVWGHTHGRVDRAQMYAVSAIEQALWDILGKSLGVPVYALLGGACREDIRVYANINRATTDRTPEGFAANAAAAVAEGFDAVKLAPFDGLQRGVDCAADARQGITCMEAVRDTIGGRVDLLVDCHSHFSVKGALEVADALRGLGLYWFEQPTPEADLNDVLEVKAQCGISLAGGEQRMLRQGFREVLSLGALDIIMPDVTVVGGISELKKVGEMAHAWEIPTSPHGPFGPVSLAAGAHAMAGLPGFTVLEHGWGEVPWRNRLTSPAERIEDGRLQLSEAPGLGFSLDQTTLDAHRVELE